MWGLSNASGLALAVLEQYVLYHEAHHITQGRIARYYKKEELIHSATSASTPSDLQRRTEIT
jgi:hypothetical protein